MSYLLCLIILLIMHLYFRSQRERIYRLGYRSGYDLGHKQGRQEEHRAQERAFVSMLSHVYGETETLYRRGVSIGYVQGKHDEKQAQKQRSLCIRSVASIQLPQ